MSKNNEHTNLSNGQLEQGMVKGKKKKTNPMGFFKLLSIYYKQFWMRWLCLIIFVIITCGITVALPKLTNIIMTQLTSGMLARSSINDPSMPWGTLIIILSNWVWSNIYCFWFFLIFTKFSWGINFTKNWNWYSN